MYRFVVLLAFGVAWAIKKECLELLSPPIFGCCKIDPPGAPPSANIDECFEKIKNLSKSVAATNCDLELCIGKKLGNIADNGTINRNAVKKQIDEQFKHRPEVAMNIKNKCINSNLEAYGPKSLCELKKISRCIRLQFVMSCPDVDNLGRCSVFKNLTAKCAAK